MLGTRGCLAGWQPGRSPSNNFSAYFFQASARDQPTSGAKAKIPWFSWEKYGKNDDNHLDLWSFSAYLWFRWFSFQSKKAAQIQALKMMKCKWNFCEGQQLVHQLPGISQAAFKRIAKPRINSVIRQRSTNLGLRVQ